MTISPKTLIIGIFSLLCSFSFTVQAANLIAFIAADTFDYSVGTSVQLDFDHILAEMKNVERYTGLTLKTITLNGKDNNTTNFLKELQSLRANKDDVIVFYYAGHGYRTAASGKSPWPNLVFTQEPKYQHKGIQYEYIIYTLMQQHPRLLITIADVCNNELRADRAPPVVNRLLAAAPNPETIRNNYKHLYLEEVGMINATGAKIGEFSTGNDEDGGAFTKAFINSFAVETESPSAPSWKTLLERASAKVTARCIEWAKEENYNLEDADRNGDIQHPYFEITTNHSVTISQ